MGPGGASPATPAAPAGPATPAAPTTPTGPAGTTGAGPTTGGGTLPTEHGKTAKTLLRMQWNYPVFRLPGEDAVPEERSGTVARAVRSALPRERAFLELAGDDRRPLLVLRECLWCNGTDDALLSRTEDNARTLLMAQWFHCVKLPPDVLEEDHPFRNVFAGDDPPHLILCDWDGSGVVTLKGDQSRTELWEAMETVLERNYVVDVKRKLREWDRLIADYDMADEEVLRLEAQLDLAIEKYGPKHAKVRKLRKQLERAHEDFDRLKAREEELRRLPLKASGEEDTARSDRDAG